MKKFVSFCKKPLLAISLSLVVLFTTLLIVVCCIPHGNVYSYEFSQFGVSLNIDLTFKSKKTVEIDMVMSVFGQAERETQKADYTIKNGYLYLTAENEDGELETRIFGKITPFSIKINSADEEAYYAPDVKLVCKLTGVLRDLSISMMVIGAVFAAGSVTLIVLDKKGIIKYKEDKQQEVENSSENN